MSVQFVDTSQINYEYDLLFYEKIRDYTYVIVKFSDNIYIKIWHEVTT